MQGPRTTFIYLAVVFGLLVVPRALQRFRLPAPLTCFAFGIIVAGFFKPLVNDSVISYLATLGIAALFLFAGRRRSYRHLSVPRNLAGGVHEDPARLRRGDCPADRGHAFFFLALGRWVVPFAPGSEFSLLLMVGLICAVITETLGVYYLVGAFVAGLVARSLAKRMTTLASTENLEAIRLFASFFIPFYFFHNGLGVPSAALVAASLLYGFVLAACIIPLRLGVVWLQSRFMQHRGHRGSLRVATALTPTLIFTLVIAELLRENFAISPQLYGGLLVYAAIASILPSLTLPAFAETTVEPIAIEA